MTPTRLDIGDVFAHGFPVTPSRTTRSSLRTLAGLAALASVFAILYLGRAVLSPVALAILLSVLLNPLVRRVEGLRIGRVASVLLVVGGVAGVFAVAAWSVTRQLIDLSLEMPQHRDTLVAKVRALRSQDYGFEEVQRVMDDVKREISGEGETTDDPDAAAEVPRDKSTDSGAASAMKGRPASASAAADGEAGQVPANRTNGDSSTEEDQEGSSSNPVAVKVVEMPPSPLQQVKNWLGPLVAPLTTTGLVAVLSIFILIQQEDLRDRCIELIGTRSVYSATEAMRRSSRYISRFVQTQFLVNALFGSAVAGGLYLLSVPNALLWGALALVLRFLPYVGPWLAAAMPVLLSVAVFDDWHRPFGVICYFVLLELAVNNILEPLAYGKSGGISSLSVIVATVFWLWIWGPVGLVVAMPITLCLIVLAEYVPTLQPLAVMLRERTGLSRHEQLYQRVLTGDPREVDRVVRASRRECDGVVEWLDTTVLPALRLADRDRQQDWMDGDAARQFIPEIQAVAARALEREVSLDLSLARPPSSRKVLCASFGGLADEAAARLLCDVLVRQGHDVRRRPLGSLANETLNELEEFSPDVLILSLLPPIAEQDGKYLLKRLAETPCTPRVVAGRWCGGADDDSTHEMGEDVDRIVHSLVECVNYVAHLPLGRAEAGEVRSDSSSSSRVFPSPRPAVDVV